MILLNIQPGDIFAVRTDALFGKLIRLRDRLRSTDGEAEYNHCGIIINSDGTTFESRRRIGRYNLFEMYAGQRVIIARPLAQDFSKKAAVKRLVNKYNGRAYPWYRIFLHAITPTLARYLHHSGVPVCSELAGEYLYLIGVRHSNFWGTTPDMLSDEWRHWREYEIIYDGILPPVSRAKDGNDGSRC